MIRPTTLAAGRVETVVGEPAEVANALRLAHDQGRLIEVTQPRPMADGRIAVRVRLVQPPPAAPRRSRRSAVIAGCVGGALVVLAGIGIAAALLFEALAGMIAAAVPALLAVGALLVLLAVLTGGKCAGIHCGGCRR